MHTSHDSHDTSFISDRLLGGGKKGRGAVAGSEAQEEAAPAPRRRPGARDRRQ